MKDFIIVTDATCDMPMEYLQANDICCLPMMYSVDGKDYMLMGKEEGLGMGDFYEMMRKGSVTKTSQVNPEDAKEFLTPVAQSGKDILYLGFSGALSGTADNVKRCLEELNVTYPNQKFLGIDSLCASMGEGLFVHYAVTMRNEGKTIDEVYNFLEDNKQNFCHYFTVNDLKYLQRGGRVSRFTAIVGTLLGIKPVLHVSPEGKLVNIAKARGRQNALKMLVEKMKNKITTPDQTVFISHGDCIDDANHVADMIKEQIGVKDIRINFIGPVIGSHSGPGTVALFFFGNGRKE